MGRQFQNYQLVIVLAVALLSIGWGLQPAAVPLVNPQLDSPKIVQKIIHSKKISVPFEFSKSTEHSDQQQKSLSENLTRRFRTAQYVSRRA